MKSQSKRSTRSNRWKVNEKSTMKINHVCIPSGIHNQTRKQKKTRNESVRKEKKRNKSKKASSRRIASTLLLPWAPFWTSSFIHAKSQKNKNQPCVHLLVNPSCEMRNEKRREVKKSIKEKKSNKSKKGHRLVVSIQLSSLRAPFRAFCVWI